jgi:hypothetical protein
VLLRVSQCSYDKRHSAVSMDPYIFIPSNHTGAVVDFGTKEHLQSVLPATAASPAYCIGHRRHKVT